MIRVVRWSLLIMCAMVSLSPTLAQENHALSATPAEGAFRNAKVHKATFLGSSVLSGKWVELDEQDVEPATGYVAKYLIGYDTQGKQLVEFDANNFGAATYSSAEGWKGHVLTMTSAVSQDAKAPYAANRFVYTVLGTDSFTVDWQVSRTSALDWIQADHLACKRRGVKAQ